MADGQVIGTTKVSSSWRMSLIVPVREVFEAEGQSVDIGDVIVFRLVDDEVVVEPA